MAPESIPPVCVWMKRDLRVSDHAAFAEAVARAQGKAADRRARFTAALAVAEPGGTVLLEVEGVCEGLILEAPRGSGGFGYDPVFLVPEAGLSFAEMSSDLKASLGHRGRALNLLAPRLRAVLS